MKKDKRSLVIVALLVVIFGMSAGYAALAQTLNINGTATVAGNWDVEITGITPTVEGTAAEATPSAFTSSTATFAANLYKPGDSITYEVTIENKGNIDAVLNTATLTPQATTTDGGAGSDAIIYEIVSQPALGSSLAAGESTSFTVKVTFDANATEIPEVTTRTYSGIFEYVQAD